MKDLSAIKEAAFIILMLFCPKVLISLGTVSVKLGELDTAYKHFQEALQRQTQVRTPHQKLHIVKALLGVG